jgi:RNA polymerase sigma-70 factor (ECF subfamily)
MCRNELLKIDTSALIQRAKRGDSFAFQELVHAYDPSISKMILHYSDSREESHNLYQRVFLTAFQRLPALRLDSSFEVRLYRILVIVLRRHSNHAPSHDLFLAQQPTHSGMMCPQEEKASRELQRLRIVILRWEQTERLVFALKHYVGLPLRRIAEILNLDEAAVRATFCRAIRHLQDASTLPERV